MKQAAFLIKVHSAFKSMDESLATKISDIEMGYRQGKAT